MKFYFKIISFSFFSFLIIILFTKTAFADTFTLSGHIQDSSGTAISGATVSVNDANSDTTTTNGSGDYSLLIPNGTYNIQVTPPAGSNFGPVLAMNQSITADTVLNFVLTPAGTATITGHVFNSSGTPVSGQRVTLQNGNTVIATNDTDSTGSYSLTATTGTYSLNIFAPQGS